MLRADVLRDHRRPGHEVVARIFSGPVEQQSDTEAQHRGRGARDHSPRELPKSVWQLPQIVLYGRRRLWPSVGSPPCGILDVCHELAGVDVSNIPGSRTVDAGTT